MCSPGRTLQDWLVILITAGVDLPSMASTRATIGLAGESPMEAMGADREATMGRPRVWFSLGRTTVQTAYLVDILQIRCSWRSSLPRASPLGRQLGGDGLGQQIQIQPKSEGLNWDRGAYLA